MGLFGELRFYEKNDIEANQSPDEFDRIGRDVPATDRYAWQQ